jgi:hypothetical protein
MLKKILQKGALGENGATKDEKAKPRLGPLEEVLDIVAKRNVPHRDFCQ